MSVYNQRYYYSDENSPYKDMLTRLGAREHLVKIAGWRAYQSTGKWSPTVVPRLKLPKVVKKWSILEFENRTEIELIVTEVEKKYSYYLDKLVKKLNQGV